MKLVVVGLLSLTGCGRIGFDLGGDRDGGVASPDPAIGALACNTSRVVDEPQLQPRGAAVVATPTGALVAWSDGGTILRGIQLDFDPGTGAIVSVARLTVTLPRPIASFGLAGDGDKRLMLSAQVGADAMFAGLDSSLQLTASPTIRPGATITTRAVAAPSAPGAPFVASWIVSGQAELSQVDDGGAPIGTPYAAPAGSDVEVRLAAQRDVAVWAAADGGGCAVWAFDTGFAPLIATPMIFAPAGACAHGRLTRHDVGSGVTVGTNLLVWIDGRALHGQLGTDTNQVGPDTILTTNAGAVDLAVSPIGFFVAIASDTGLLVGLVHADATGTSLVLPPTPLTGDPFELIEHGREALMVSVVGPDVPRLALTRICEP